MNGQNARRPKIASAAGSIVSMKIIASADAERPDRPEAGGRVDVGEDQHEQRRHHREAGGEDRRAGRAERDPDRVVLVVVAPQLLPVSGDEQQRVVRARAEHEHGRIPPVCPLIVTPASESR